MAGAEDIVAISIPFTTGVVVAAFLPSGEESYFLAALSCSVCLGILLAVVCLRRTARPELFLLYFLTGFLFYCSSAITGTPDYAAGNAANRMDRLCSLIESVGYRHRETSALVEALITGRRGGLSPEIREWFRKSGASHILALSGLHLGVIYALVSKVLGIFGNGRKVTVARSLTIIVLSGAYARATGASPSIVRAFLFITLGELSGLMYGRKKKPVRILCAALMLQLAASPRIIESVGFQLSYLAMFGIFLLFPYLKNFHPVTGRFDPVGRIWNSAAMSVSCQVFTAPVVWWHFGTFPEYFILTNLIALPLTEFLVAVSVVAIALHSAGICPEILKDINDRAAQILIRCLHVISTL